MNYRQWLYGNGCCEPVNDCGCSGKDACDCDNILLEISKLQTNDEILQEEIDNITSGGSVTVDYELSITSTNPVQNKVITEALNDKLDASAYTPVSFDVPIYNGDGLLSVSVNNPSQYNLNKINGMASIGAGLMVETKNVDEAAFGSYNISSGGDQQFTFSSGNTLFSVGNGNTQAVLGWPIKPHNAFEIRQNGDIYIADTNDTEYQEAFDKPMIKLQDILKSLQDQIDALRNG